MAKFLPERNHRDYRSLLRELVNVELILGVDRVRPPKLRNIAGIFQNCRGSFRQKNLMEPVK